MKRRQGLTLLEILIAICMSVIMGAFATMWGNQAATTARAAKIIVNMQAVRTAAMAWYSDHYEEVMQDPDLYPTIADLKPYIDNDLAPELKEYIVFSTNAKVNASATTLSGTNMPASWWVVHSLMVSSGTSRIDSTSELNLLQQKLAGRAKEVGLYQLIAQSTNRFNYSTDPPTYKYNGQNFEIYNGTRADRVVFMRIR